MTVQGLQRKVKKNRKRAGICGQNNDLRCSTVEGLCCLVGTLLEKTLVGCLLDDVEDLSGQRGVCDWPCGGRIVGHGMVSFRIWYYKQLTPLQEQEWVSRRREKKKEN